MTFIEHSLCYLIYHKCKHILNKKKFSLLLIVIRMCCDYCIPLGVMLGSFIFVFINREVFLPNSYPNPVRFLATGFIGFIGIGLILPTLGGIIEDVSRSYRKHKITFK